jgi:hypothetical protein
LRWGVETETVNAGKKYERAWLEKWVYGARGGDRKDELTRRLDDFSLCREVLDAGSRIKFSSRKQCLNHAGGETCTSPWSISSYKHHTEGGQIVTLGDSWVV